MTKIRNSNFSYNSALLEGGAVSVRGGETDIVRSTFSCNFCVRDEGSGGGAAFFTDGSDVHMRLSTLTNNHVATQGGAVALVGWALKRTVGVSRIYLRYDPPADTLTFIFPNHTV